MRGSLHSSAKRTVSSILGIVLFVNLPIVWMSVQWWRGSLHPRNVTMTGDMRMTLMISMLAWLVFLLAALLSRLRLEWAREAALERGDSGLAAQVARRAVDIASGSMSERRS